MRTHRLDFNGISRSQSPLTTLTGPLEVSTHGRLNWRFVVITPAYELSSPSRPGPEPLDLHAGWSHTQSSRPRVQIKVRSWSLSQGFQLL